MSAAKRVQRLLRQAEKRAMASATADLQKGINKMDEKERLAHLAKGQEMLRQEKVFIKATGRAIEKALDLGRWFEQKEGEYVVQVKPGSVLVVDDILEDGEAKEEEEKKEEKEERLANGKAQQETNQVMPAGTIAHDMTEDESLRKHDTTALPEPSVEKKKKKRRRSKRNALSADAELPESRTRWVNMVEITVNLK
jgi:ribonuclease P/MRP protein subunit POP7